MARKQEPYDPLQLAWRVRADLRGDAPVGDPIPPSFQMWWNVIGAGEYTGWPPLTGADRQGLMEPLPDWPRHGQFGMTPALHYLMTLRSDLAKSFDVRTEHGLWAAIAWFFCHGVREHRLHTALDPLTLAALDETPEFFRDASDGSCTSITWLMFFLWRDSVSLQEHFDLHTQSGRLSYLQWFYMEGVPHMRLGPLVAPRWAQWLREPVAIPQRHGASTPRAALLLWNRRAELQTSFDLGSPEGAAGLNDWIEQAWQTEPALRWTLPPQSLPAAPDRDRSAPSTRPFGLNLIGFAFGELGIGEDVRMAASACEAAGIPFAVVNIHPGDYLRQGDMALEALVGNGQAGQDQAPYAINLFCLTAFDTVRALLERGPTLFAGRYNIGWWPWELPVWPRDWNLAFEIVDEVWAATHFTETMYKASASAAHPDDPCPVTWMPLPASVARVTPMPRAALGLPEKRFLFLYVFDFNSYLARKNPFAALAAFRLAFDPADDSVGLVLKTMNSRPDNPEWKRFVRECAKDRRITLLDTTLARGEVLGLILACDAYLSLHRSEGFGRTLAEAMLFGKPVVGTDFSGNADFLTSETGYPVKWKRRKVKAGEYPFITERDQAWWADPDIADAARQMHAARAAAQAPGRAARTYAFALDRFSPHRIGERMREHLTDIAARLADQ